MDSKTLWTLAANTSRIILLINVVLLLIFYKKLPRQIRVFSIFMGIGLLTELLLLLVLKKGQNNMPWLHAYTLLEFVSLSLFYKTVFSDFKRLQRWFWWFFAAIILFLVNNSIFIESIYGFNSNAKTVVQVLMIGFAVTYFFRSFGNSDFTEPRHFALALINSAVVLYYSGSLFVFMFAKFINAPDSATSYQVKAMIWSFNSCLFLLFQLLIFTALWKTIRTRTR